jgi:hypothetical protein
VNWSSPATYDRNTTVFAHLRHVAVARYHLLLAPWDHWLFAGETPYFRHRTNISALFNELERVS